ncbi:MAG TPA: helix-turn-helix transcriptional regulator [Conexibacter sp.]|jgi:transcriptional regulator with XRE-family HTH domain|nr:helix-turn-helix transcriptional regulator [Conexibacter sp.]
MRHQRTRQSRKSANHDALGRAVFEARARRGLSQEELGFRAKLHRNYVGAVERGEINPTFKTLLALTRGLALPLSELVRVYERNIAEVER